MIQLVGFAFEACITLVMRFIRTERVFRANLLHSAEYKEIYVVHWKITYVHMHIFT